MIQNRLHMQENIADLSNAPIVWGSTGMYVRETANILSLDETSVSPCREIFNCCEINLRYMN